MILGTYDPDLLEPMAKVLMNLGIKRAMLVYGNDRLDEDFYLSSNNYLRDKRRKAYQV